ncbi:hypothetical protein ID866_6979 [Astraeus odoratus]|nr:hypothetical protein ID866_6979 [Astraeus odoratus]
MLGHHPFKRRRRTATAVLAGDFDLRPPRDVLTSLLNGVGPYKEVEKDEELRRSRKREKEKEKEKEKERREREKERKRPRLPSKASDQRPSDDLATGPNLSPPSPPQSISAPPIQTTAFWRASHRPTINIATNQRSVSVTPPPLASSPRSTPGPSSSSVTSRTSSKRPRTPYDDVPTQEPMVATPPLSQPPPRKKRVAVKKGWKGWVEGSPPPSEKLINLDAVPILQERRTRSGKSFDAIGVGKETWV